MLVARGYVVQGPDGLYQLGHQIVRLGLLGQSRACMHTVAKPHLALIAGETQEKSELWSFEQEGYLLLDVAECPQSVVLKAQPGSQFKYTGQTAIAVLGKAALQEAESGKAYTDFVEKLQNNDQVYRGATVIRDHTGKGSGCICIAAPAFRVGPKEKKAFRSVLGGHAQSISKELGFQAKGV